MKSIDYQLARAIGWPESKIIAGPTSVSVDLGGGRLRTFDHRDPEVMWEICRHLQQWPCKYWNPDEPWAGKWMIFHGLRAIPCDSPEEAVARAVIASPLKGPDPQPSRARARFEAHHA